MTRVLLVITSMLGCCLNLMAQEGDSTSLRPSFGVDYTGEVQTDFKQVRQVNLLQLHADIPLSRKFSFQAASISTLFTKKELEIVELQGYSNIEAYIKIPFAFTVAGITWQPNDHHSLFAGIRRTDEDYFCSDGLALFTNSSCGIFPTLSWNFPIATFPLAAMGIHYAYDHENLRLQASLYNGKGYYDFTGHSNIFRICPKSDGLFAIGQAEYRHRGSHYYIGGSLHTQPDVKPTGMDIRRTCAYAQSHIDCCLWSCFRKRQFMRKLLRPWREICTQACRVRFVLRLHAGARHRRMGDRTNLQPSTHQLPDSKARISYHHHQQLHQLRRYAACGHQHLNEQQKN